MPCQRTGTGLNWASWLFLQASRSFLYGKWTLGWNFLHSSEAVRSILTTGKETSRGSSIWVRVN